MPNTYAELRVRHRLGADPCDPHNNILAGVAFSVRSMLDRYGSRALFAAYDAKYRRLRRTWSREAGRCRGETQVSVAKVAPMIGVQPGEDRSAPLRSLRLVVAALFPAPRCVPGRSFVCRQSAAGSFPGLWST